MYKGDRASGWRDGRFWRRQWWWVQNSVNLLHASELCAQQWLRWQVCCVLCVFITTERGPGEASAEPEAGGAGADAVVGGPRGLQQTARGHFLQWPQGSKAGLCCVPWHRDCTLVGLVQFTCTARRWEGRRNAAPSPSREPGRGSGEPRLLYPHSPEVGSTYVLHAGRA